MHDLYSNIDSLFNNNIPINNLLANKTNRSNGCNINRNTSNYYLSKYKLKYLNLESIYI